MRRYTLTELLVAVGVLSLLLTLGALFLRSRHRRPGCGRPSSKAKAEIHKLRVALAHYNADTRQYPEPLEPRTSPGAALADASPTLYAALMLPPARGGGPNAPYVGDPSWLGLVVRPSAFAADTMGSDGRSGVRVLSEAQAALPPGPTERRVFLDPWGNPYHYRQWASVKASLRNDLRMSPPLRTGFGAPRPLERPLIKQTLDLPHTDTFELWSNGPNGVNEFGDPDSDDVVSWR